jgi:hypothetical protein
MKDICDAHICPVGEVSAIFVALCLPAQARCGQIILNIAQRGSGLKVRLSHLATN